MVRNYLPFKAYVSDWGGVIYLLNKNAYLACENLKVKGSLFEPVNNRVGGFWL